MTVNDLIIATLKMIGVVAKSETPTPDESSDAFARLNDMIDSWAADRLTIYGVSRSLFPVTVGKQTYSIGPTGADWTAPRPLAVQDAGIVNTATNPALELRMAVLSDDEWAHVSLKGMTSSLPWVLYYDYASPNGNISLWPIPTDGALQVAIYAPVAVTQFAGLTSTVLLPPGYAEAIRYNLAVRLAPEFGRPLDPTIATLAVQTKANLERANTRDYELEIDPRLLSGVSRNNSAYAGMFVGGGGTIAVQQVDTQDGQVGSPGTYWLQATGVSPNRTVSLMYNDNGDIVTVAQITV